MPVVGRSRRCWGLAAALRQHIKCAEHLREGLERGWRLPAPRPRRRSPQQKSAMVRGGSAAGFQPLHRALDRPSARQGGEQQRHRAKEKPVH